MLKISKLITHNFWVKVLSLVLAVATWFYVTWQLKETRDKEQKAIFNMIHYDVVSSALPIQVTILGKVRDGYEVVQNGITASPVECIVIGPRNILEGVTVAKTVPIDISGCAKNVDKRVSLAPIASGIAIKEEFVKIHIPIVKKEEPAKPAETQ
ncbi:MAG: YbbR-like domain-containing protein [Candidatus Omnitrophica bacterium]|nr:YbbR-like domain-containing protein [Candidatus Omnitrophota bacterium]